MGSVGEYQWKATLGLSAGAQYCYRVYLGTTDLLGSDPSPWFWTQLPAGSTQSFSFAVLGDTGQLVDRTGSTTTCNGNPDQANVMARIANSGVRFLVQTGDFGHPNNDQKNFGDLTQTGCNTSAVFGPDFWKNVGASIPTFTAPGNHGVSNNALLVDFPQSQAVSTSSGKYAMVTYCCLNGTNSQSQQTAWYAFDAGNARFYVLTAAWADNNLGTITSSRANGLYQNDYDNHWTPSSPQYQWLKSDLEAHASTPIKFAFFHFPMYSDNATEVSDSELQGANSLEGLLASNGVRIAFTGHAHMYERNKPSALGLVTYVTGGGGARLEPITGDGCASFDAYGIGWSYSANNGAGGGSRCGAVPATPTSITQVFHFLEVTVNGTSVTVAPTDEMGRTFDVQTYDFSGSGTPPGSITGTVTDATTNSPIAGATVSYSGGSATTDSSGSYTLNDVPPGSYSVTASASGYTSQTQAVSVRSGTAAQQSFQLTPTPPPDTTPPTAPDDLSATADSSTSVALSWTASTDDVALTGYNIYRSPAGAGSWARIGSTSGAASYTDNTAAASTSYDYRVTAFDAAGNESDPSSVATVTTPVGTPPVFSDGFESGNLNNWTSRSGLAVEGSITHSGSYAAEGNTTNGGTYAKKTLPATYADAYSRIYFDLVSQSSQVNLLRLRTSGGTSIGYLYVSTSGKLGLRNDAGGATFTSTTSVSLNTWHSLELHTVINGTSSSTEVWLDGTKVDELSVTTSLGTAPVGQLQIGEVQSGRTYDVVFDDVIFDTQRIGT